MKSLSKKYLNKLLIGEVRTSEAVLVEKLQVTKFPTLLVVSDAESFKGDVYTGEIKVDQLSKFLDNYAYSQVKKPVRFEKLTEQRYKSGQLCGPKDSGMCLILFEDPSAHSTIQSLPLKFENDPIQFVYIKKGEPGY
jgi:hypothetical protein